MKSEMRALIRMAVVAALSFFVTDTIGVEPAEAEAGARFELVGLLRDDAVAGAHDIEVRGNVAYVAGKANRHGPGRAGRFTILDVSDPAAPSVRAVVDEVQEPAVHNAQTVLLRDDVCLLGADALLAYDIANPAAPRRTALVQHEEIARINGMIAWGDHAVAVNKSGFLNLFDIRQATKPVYRGSLNTKERGDLLSPHDIARFGKHHLVVPSAGRDVPVHFGIYHVSDDGESILPLSEWRCTGTVSDERLAGANRIVADTRHAYVACHYSNRIGVVDLANPASPALVATIETQGAEPDGLALAGDMLFVGAGKTVEAIDVSDPARPRSVACYRGGPLFTLPETGRAGNAHDLVVQGDLVYVTAQRDGAVGILRFYRE